MASQADTFVTAFNLSEDADVQSWSLPGLQGTHIIPLSRPKSETNVFAKLAAVLEQERKPSAEEIALQKEAAAEEAKRVAFEAELESLRQKAKDEGFKQGHAEGLAQGLEEGHKQGEEQGAAEIAEAISSLNKVTCDYATPLQSQEHEVAKTLAGLVQRLALTTLEAELQSDSKHIERILLDSLQQLPKHLPVTVSLHPTNIARITGQFTHPEFEIELLEDAALDLGSCKLSNGHSEIFQSYTERFDHYSQQLLAALVDDAQETS